MQVVQLYHKHNGLKLSMGFRNHIPDFPLDLQMG